MQKVQLGLIVNPVAGMGGSVGLKGTDGEMYKEALALGSEPVTPGRTQEMLAHIQHQDQITWLAAPGAMGADFLAEQALPVEVVGITGEETSAADTKRICGLMLEKGVDLLVFVGGDGTARDVYDAVDQEAPVVGVPSGVKILSTVFSVSARAAAEMIDAFIEGADLIEEEVLDIDEEAYRQDRLAAQLYGALRVPDVREQLQPAKIASSQSQSPEANKDIIAGYTADSMEPGTLYLLGPGTTVRAITDDLGIKKTLLGIDAVLDGKLVGVDLNEKGILELLDAHPQRKIIVTPIGGSGFIFGRGSKPFTPQVIQRVGVENIWIVSTREKIKALECLRVDTGDLETDQALAGYQQVIVGDHQRRMVKVQC